MFEIEMISLLNKYKNCETDFDKNKFKNSIKKMIFENSGEFDKFISSSSLDSNTINFLKGLEKESESENLDNNDETKADDLESDLEKIKQAYVLWRTDFVNNSRVPTLKCEQIINEMINFYGTNRFFILKRVLDIVDDNDFESFKTMLKNYIRKYFAEKITVYYQSDEFKSLGFFDKRKKKKEILSVIENMAKYNFDERKIMEIFK